jgi:hypothetical protein
MAVIADLPPDSAHYTTEMAKNELESPGLGRAGDLPPSGDAPMAER